MTERYTGKLHHLREQARTRWGEVREQGGAREAVTKQVSQIITRFGDITGTVQVEVVRSSFIRRVNAGEDYDHHYRRKSR